MYAVVMSCAFASLE